MLPPDMLWGVRDENDTWNGVVGMMQRRVCCIVLIAFMLEAYRVQIMAFTAITVLLSINEFYTPHCWANMQLYNSLTLAN